MKDAFYMLSIAASPFVFAFVIWVLSGCPDGRRK
jgi:hypothetical protein